MMPLFSFHVNTGAEQSRERGGHVCLNASLSTGLLSWFLPLLLISLEAYQASTRSLNNMASSARCFVRWKETKIDEAKIKDENLLGQFEKQLKYRCGEEPRRAWVGEKAVRCRRYGRN